MFHGGPRALRVQAAKNIKLIRFSSFRHGTYLFYVRLFINSILAFIFLYIDIISFENGTSNDGGKVLLAIAVYATAQLAIKVILALLYHIIEHCRILCCYKNIAEDTRAQAINDYWRK